MTAARVPGGADTDGVPDIPGVTVSRERPAP